MVDCATVCTKGDTSNMTAYDRITQLNQKNSPFLQLPAELRNRIYRFGLDEGIVDFKSRRRTGQNKAKALGLLCTCRQIYHETSVLYFALNTFRFDCDVSLGEFARILTSVKLSAVKTIILAPTSVSMIEFRARHPGVPLHDLQLHDLRLDALSSLQEVTVNVCPTHLPWANHDMIGVYLRQETCNMGLEVFFVKDERACIC